MSRNKALGQVRVELKKSSVGVFEAEMEVAYFRALNDLFEPERRHQNRKRVRETEQSFEYTFSVPGASKDDVKVEVEGSRVDVKVEGRNSPFRRAPVRDNFRLPDRADVTNVDAYVENGLLLVTAPKRLRAEPTAVTVGDEHKDLENAYRMSLRVPGAGKEDIVVEHNEGTLFIAAKAEQTSFFRPFRREFQIPKDADIEGIVAECRNGVLSVLIPRIEPVKIVLSTDVIPEDDYAIEVELPGIEAEQVHIEKVADRCDLKITNASKPDEVDYEHKFNVPGHVDVSKIQASLRNGILTIAAPRKEGWKYSVDVRTPSRESASTEPAVKVEDVDEAKEAANTVAAEN